MLLPSITVGVVGALSAFYNEEGRALHYTSNCPLVSCSVTVVDLVQSKVPISQCEVDLVQSEVCV